VKKLGLSQFARAGAQFEAIDMFKEAGQCYFSAKEYNKAIECFDKKGMRQ
jgi:tetratricopeptide (TPR) repeat protein